LDARPWQELIAAFGFNSLAVAMVLVVPGRWSR
jgi:hypothetical protein